ncbi:type IV secretory system conjugative DNA transfer family protein [Burkholderia alba]|uniref:type IV secretory system conjugative DNA transfer family protein n=1 Tax=Burkholderia alba TaxID=2683677 RepID=UPI002B0585F5|nr:type IV secretory system conjugative DNA transfer family protein [Burkholderia alba]
MKLTPIRAAVGLVAVLLVLTGLAAAGQYAGATLFAKIEKLPDSAIGIWTLWDYWYAYGGVRKVRTVLQIAIAASILVPLLPVAVVAAALLVKPHRELHGSARFARPYEIRQYGLMDEAMQRDKRNTRQVDVKRNPTILLGKCRYNGRDVYLTYAGQQFVMVVAPTRSGKGTAVAIPNLLTYSDSMVVLDVKGEAFDITSGFRQRCGQKVFRWAPFDASGYSHRWNPLERIARSEPFERVGRLQSIAARLYHSPDARNKFFYEQASDLFVALALHLIEMTGYCTFGQVLRLATTPQKKVREHWNDLVQHEPRPGVPLSGDCMEAFARVLASPDDTMLNIVATFNSGLRLFSDPIVDLATSACDFDLGQVRRELMTVYVILPVKKLNVASLIGNLFFTDWIEENLDALPGQDPTLKYQCLGLLDEFTALGRIDVLDKGNAFIAGYNLRLLTILQSKSQGEAPELYGQHGMRTLVTNHGAMVVYPPRNDQDAKEISETLGTFTEQSTSNSRSFGRHSSRGTNTSDQRRALMLDQELKGMDDDQEIVLGFKRPILAEKAHYYADALFVDRLRLVSPSLAAIKKRLPTEDEFKAAWYSGEMRAAGVPTLDPRAWHASQSAKSAASIRQSRVVGAPALTAADVLALDRSTASATTLSWAVDGVLADILDVTGEPVRDDVRQLLEALQRGVDVLMNAGAAEAPPLDPPSAESAHRADNTSREEAEHG